MIKLHEELCAVTHINTHLYSSVKVITRRLIGETIVAIVFYLFPATSEACSFDLST